MRTQLLTHNKTAYHKVIKALETANRTCVVHPTGTGKSYLIAAVSESYKKVLILAPNIFVLNQVRNVLRWRKQGVEYMTYARLMMEDDMPTGYDLICLDEFHRAGATEWGDAVLYLLRLNPQAKVFGTTATPIRDCDNNRNMAEELFKRNVASVMSIAEAWNRNILPVPTYVTGIFDFSHIFLDVREKIKGSNYITRTEKRQRLTRLNNLRLDWERSNGMPQILRKYLNNECRRIIVFCANIEQLQQMKDTVCEWFKKAELVVGDVCVLHNDLSDKQQRQMMEAFEKDDDNGIKLMFSVNMLNEGVHIPRVNAVLMLRTTSSRIIYTQQLGRCLTAANTDKPIVFDMVDNMSQTNIIHTIRDEFNRLELERKDGVSEPREFVIHDRCKSYREMVIGLTEGITNNWETDEQVVARVLAFIEKHGRLPRHDKSIEEKRLYDKMMSRRSVMEANERIAPLLDLCVTHRDRSLTIIREFIAENGRLPRIGEWPYYGKWCSLKTHKENPEVLAIIRDYTARHMTDFEATTWAEKIIDFIKEYKRLPNNNHKEESEITNKFYLLKKNYLTRPKVAEMIALASQYSIQGDDEIAQEVIRFEKENGRMPKSASENHLYNKFLRRRSRLMETNPDIEALCRKYYHLGETAKERLERLKAYCKEHGHLPRRREEPELYKYIAYLREHTSEEFEQLMKDYKPRVMLSNEERNRRIGLITAFVKEHGRLPSTSRLRKDEVKLSDYLRRFKVSPNVPPEIKALLVKYPTARQKHTSSTCLHRNN